MRLLSAACAALVMALVFAGQAVGQVDSNSYIQEFEGGSISWEDGLITAVGIGSAPPNAVNLGQARAMALRAATVVARRKLLEIVKGVQIDSATTVRNYIVSDDRVEARIRGFLQNSRVIDTGYLSDGSVEVTVGVKLRGGFADTLIPTTTLFKRTRPEPPAAPPVEGGGDSPLGALEPAPLPEETPPMPETAPPLDPAPGAELGPVETAPAPAYGGYTGLIIDARGLGAKPAMSPRILDKDGNVVYGSEMVGREYAIQHGMAGYAKDPDMAAQNVRVASNPYMVKAESVTGKAGTDLVIGADQAAKLKQLAQNQDFLEKCKVMIVLD